MRTVLYSDDINLLSHWEKALQKGSFESVDELHLLEELRDAIIILNYSSCRNKSAEVLGRLREQNNYVLVLDRVPELHKAKKLLHEGAMGYGNALMREHFILSAVAALREGMVWLYPELTSQLILEMPSTEHNNAALLQKLTSREKEVALFLKEGLTYSEIADKLTIKPRTVKAHAQAIYKKLDVHDRIGLALLLK